MKTPQDILAQFEQASIGLNYGTVTLTLSIKQGRPLYILAREESFLPKSDVPTRVDFSVNGETVLP